MEERKEIVNRLKQFDINSWNKTKVLRSKHVTKGAHDREMQVKELLDDKNICNDLKQKTLMIDYVWLYPQHC